MAPRLAVRSNLPAETSSFVGRRAELVQARRMLGNLRLVTVTGPGGVGKTRLALRVAARARRAFPDGGHLVDLTRLQQPGLLGDTVLQVLGMVDLSSRPAAAVLAERLSGLRLLLVLDNCEHLIDACADLVHLLLRATPDVHVLATSREPLRLPGESVLEVAPVPADDAMALFEARGRAVLPGFAISSDNRDIVAELCQRLDRLPLAVELAAAWLRVLSAAQILDRLGDGFGLLAPPGRTGRNESLQATVDWSAELLGAGAGAVGPRLGVRRRLRPEWCAAGLRRRRDGAGSELLPLLSNLVDKSIIAARPSDPAVRYVWLDTLRAYGLRLLAERGEERAMRRRHRDWCLALTRPLIVTNNFLAWSISLTGYAALFAGDLGRARPLLEDGYARHRAPGNRWGTLATASGLAQTTSYLGDPVSEAISREALAFCAELGVRGLRTAALRSLGLELVRQGRIEEATTSLREALEISRQVHQYGAAYCIELLAWAAQASGEPERAARLLGGGRAAYRSIGATMPRPQQDSAERYTEQVRRALGRQEFDAAYRQGEQLRLPEAVGYALREAPERHPPPAAEPSPQTRRERQVAAMVARGLTARQIAAELVISPRTAESHVGNILAKLEMTSRTQIAAWHASHPG